MHASLYVWLTEYAIINMTFSWMLIACDWGGAQYYAQEDKFWRQPCCNKFNHLHKKYSSDTIAFSQSHGFNCKRVREDRRSTMLPPTLWPFTDAITEAEIVPSSRKGHLTLSDNLLDMGPWFCPHICLSHINAPVWLAEETWIGEMEGLGFETCRATPGSSTWPYQHQHHITERTSMATQIRQKEFKPICVVHKGKVEFFGC